VSRYQSWALECLKIFQEGPESVNEIKRSETSKDLQKLDTSKRKSIKKSTSDQHLSELDKPAPVLSISIDDLVLIYCDIQHLVSSIPKLITSGMGNALPDLSVETYATAIATGVSVLKDVLPKLSEAISSCILESPSKLVKSVGDIPRMYRRTNREVPSKPCSYVITITEDLKDFFGKQRSKCDLDVLKNWLGISCEELLGLYLGQVQEVLSSVAKMEESLRKLKKVRERGGTGATKDKTGGLSDDDKIRLQLYLDVMYLLRELSSDDVGGLTEGNNGVKIRDLVQQAVKGFISDIEG